MFDDNPVPAEQFPGDFTPQRRLLPSPGSLRVRRGDLITAQRFNDLIDQILALQARVSRLETADDGGGKPTADQVHQIDDQFTVTHGFLTEIASLTPSQFEIAQQFARNKGIAVAKDDVHDDGSDSKL